MCILYAHRTSVMCVIHSTHICSYIIRCIGTRRTLYKADVCSIVVRAQAGGQMSFLMGLLKVFVDIGVTHSRLVQCTYYTRRARVCIIIRYIRLVRIMYLLYCVRIYKYIV